MSPRSADYPDGWLLLLLDWATEGILAVDLTLMIGGVVVCGTPTSYEEFGRAFGETIAEGMAHAANPGAPDLVRELFAEQGQRDTERFQVRREEFNRLVPELRLDRNPPLPDDVQDTIRERLNSRSRNYIVLKDVEIHGAGHTPARVPLWRGRVSEVTGWHLGRWQLP